MSEDNYSQVFMDSYKKQMDFINQNREQLIQSWIAKTGLSPQESVLVEQREGNKINIWIEPRADRCFTHRDEIEALRTQLNRALNTLRVISSDCRQSEYKGVEFDSKGTRDYIAMVFRQIEETGGEETK